MSDQQQPAPSQPLEVDEAHVEVAATPAPQSHSFQPPPALSNTSPWQHFLAFAVLAVFDMGMNAAGGACAAIVGAHLNDKQVTHRIIHLGALAGLIKSAMTTFREVVTMRVVNFVARMLLSLIFSSFGICIVTAAVVCDLVLKDTPKELLIASIVAAIPLFFESIREIEPKIQNSKGQSKEREACQRSIVSVCLIASDALGGYVFARMASDLKMPISNCHAASSAGAVFGTFTFLARLVNGCIVNIKIRKPEKLTTVFGTYKVVHFEPIVLSDKEYQVLKSYAPDVMHAVDWFQKLILFGRRAVARLFGRRRREEDIWGDV